MAGGSVFTHERISPRGFTGSRSILVEPLRRVGKLADARGASSRTPSTFPWITIRTRTGLFEPVRAQKAVKQRFGKHASKDRAPRLVDARANSKRRYNVAPGRPFLRRLAISILQFVSEVEPGAWYVPEGSMPIHLQDIKRELPRMGGRRSSLGELTAWLAARTRSVNEFSGERT
jgi:hypothetical protein